MKFSCYNIKNMCLKPLIIVGSTIYLFAILGLHMKCVTDNYNMVQSYKAKGSMIWQEIPQNTYITRIQRNENQWAFSVKNETNQTRYSDSFWEGNINGRIINSLPLCPNYLQYGSFDFYAVQQFIKEAILFNTCDPIYSVRTKLDCNDCIYIMINHYEDQYDDCSAFVLADTNLFESDELFKEFADAYTNMKLQLEVEI